MDRPAGEGDQFLQWHHGCLLSRTGNDNSCRTARMTPINIMVAHIFYHGFIMYSGSMFILKGILGIIFGLLLLAVPDFTLGAFLTIFGVFLIAAGVIAFLFAVTSQQTDTMFWFIVSGGIILLGLITFIVPHLFAILFALCIAGWVLITGAWDLENYICSHRRFYTIMAGLTVASLALIAVSFYLLPFLRTHYLTAIFGIYAAVFGVFSLVLGEMIIRGKIPPCLLPVPPKA